MDGIVVKRYYGGGNGGDDRCRLTVLSPVDLSPKVACVNLSLPSYVHNKYITCSSCCGLLSFDDGEGNIVLCNLATRQQKRLPPPPKSKPRFKLFARGLGYDSKSDDFKVIRFLQQPYYEWGRFRDYNERCELYSLKSGVWKDIPTPDASVSQTSGVYVGGRCYWTASLGFSFGGSSSDAVYYDILSFDFTTESFHCLHSPPHSSNTGFHVVEYRGSLGAIGFSRSDDDTRGFGFEFWVREECSWTKVFDVVLSNVGRIPVELIDGRFLFLERRCLSNPRLYQLVVYDRITKERKEFDIYDYYDQMMVTSYVEGQVALPDAMPMRRYESDHTDEEDEEDDDDSGDSCMSTDDEEENDNEDEDEDDENEEEEEKQINMRRRERCDDWYDDDVDDSCEDEEDDDDTEHSGMSTDDDDDDDDEEENDDDDDGDYDEDEDKEADDR